MPDPTIDQIVTGTTIEAIVAAVADDDVISRIPGPVDRGCAGECEMLHVRSDRQRYRTLYRIDPAVGQFSDDIGGLFDHINIVARSTDQRIGPRPAVQCIVPHPAREEIVATVTRKHIVESIPGPVDRGRTG